LWAAKKLGGRDYTSARQELEEELDAALSPPFEPRQEGPSLEQESQLHAHAFDLLLPGVRICRANKRRERPDTALREVRGGAVADSRFSA